MFKFWTTCCALLVAVTLTACGGGGGGSAEQPAPAAQVETPAETPAPAETVADTTAAAQTASITFEGTLGCGHCDHQIGTSCSAAVQTADGKVYILQEMAAGSEPFDQRFGHKPIRVTGSVVETDGIAYVKVDSYEIL